ncbi:RNA-binding protein 1 [Artemisia annua]|uniref:RNA-binding protein 1 n=1 Tax=Artemisia annua TaxID=35608 RepID=A0A2U1KVT0_ARTAN|nr:RNA-binding protein 1 [Artemisia annua]
MDSWETTEDMLKDHFRSYGNVVGSVIAKDRMTGNPRGFAFVSFSDASALNKVVADTHTILGRMVEVKKAVPRSQQNQYLHEQNRGQNSHFRTNEKNDALTNSFLQILSGKSFPANLQFRLPSE